MNFPFSIVFLSCALLFNPLNCQVYTSIRTNADTLIQAPSPGLVVWNLPHGLSSLIEAYKRENYKEAGIEGFRIQLFSDGGNNAKDRAQALLEELIKNNPETPSYLTYQQPNFKVRIGNFRTKAEARQFQTILSQNYPGCFIVRDLIKVN